MPNVETALYDVKNYSFGLTIPDWIDDPRTKEWKDTAARAHGFIIVTPEYNHGFPGELKLMLDTAHKEYFRKPVGLCMVSSGGLGGARGGENMLSILIGHGMSPMRAGVYFSNVKELFTENGAIKDASYHEKLQKMFTELLWYVERLNY